jgi:hypothetical protein
MGGVYMKRMLIWLILLLLYMVSPVGSTDKIYYWIDENGVRHFSNRESPKDIEQVGKQPQIVRPTPPDQEQNIEPNQKAIQTVEPAAEQKPGQAEEDRGRQAEKERLEQKVQQERERLQAEIDRIDRLMIGVSFTQGMKDNMMRPYQDQLDVLNADPAEYFAMKAKGVFTN